MLRIKSYLNNIVAKILFIRLSKNKKSYSNYLNKPSLFWGPIPILNNKYNSIALNKIGFDSKSVMNGYYDSINKKTDYDLYLMDLIDVNSLSFFDRKLYWRFSNIYILNYLLEHFDIFHIPYSGLLFGNSDFKYLEKNLLKKFNKKIIVLPYGGDSYLYSKVINESLKYGLMISYPKAGIFENKITEQVNFWQQYADFRMGCIAIDGFSLIEILPVNYLVIDTEIWQSKKIFSEADGINEEVTIIHTPNHRGFKGTEFIIDAINKLKLEGLKINLVLLENIQNSQVQEIMLGQADILVEQLIFIGYALSGIEGMASGIPVLSNLSDKRYTDLFRRYSYLNECPILSSTPENIIGNLRILIKNPLLRKELGIAGRKFAEKYHSYNLAQKMYTKIYDKIWNKRDFELWNYFHPLNPDSYNNQIPKIEHPLFENKIPEALLNTLNK